MENAPGADYEVLQTTLAYNQNVGLKVIGLSSTYLTQESSEVNLTLTIRTFRQAPPILPARIPCAVAQGMRCDRSFCSVPKEKFFKKCDRNGDCWNPYTSMEINSEFGWAGVVGPV